VRLLLADFLLHLHLLYLVLLLDVLAGLDILLEELLQGSQLVLFLL